MRKIGITSFPTTRVLSSIIAETTAFVVECVSLWVQGLRLSSGQASAVNVSVSAPIVCHSCEGVCNSTHGAKKLQLLKLPVSDAC